MEKDYSILPVVKVIDEWENELEGVLIIYQIKLTSGDHQPDWYPVTCWQKGITNHTIGDRFNERPTRARVEAHFKQLIFDCIITEKIKDSLIF